jgi:ferredoxin-type protein NapH
MHKLSNLVRRDPRKKISLISAMLLTIVMAFNVYFFHIQSPMLDKSLSSTIAGWIMFLFLVSLFFLLLYTGNISTYRRIFFVSSALLLFPAFIAGMYETFGHMYLTEENVMNSSTSYCHIVTPMIILPYLFNKTIIFPAKIFESAASVYGMLIIWLLATLVSGKGFCSWICFYGGWDDGFSRIRKKPLLKLNPENKKLRFFGFAMLAFVVLASLFTLTVIYCEWLCPFKLITEYAQVVDMKSFIAFTLFVLAFFGLVVVLPLLTKKRFQCLAFCPFGAFQALLDRLSLYRVHIDPEKCTQCLRCISVCPTLALSKEIILGKKTRPHLTCTKCGECFKACKSGAISYAFSLGKNRPASNPSSFVNKLKSNPTGRNKALIKIFSVVKELLSPQSLFIFSSYTLGMIIMSAFARSTVQRTINLILTGSFLLY